MRATAFVVGVGLCMAACGGKAASTGGDDSKPFGYYPFEGDLREASGGPDIFTQSPVGPGDQGPASFQQGWIGRGLEVGGCTSFTCYGHNVVADGVATRWLFAGDFTVSTWVRVDVRSEWDQYGILRKPGAITIRRWTSNATIQVLLGADESPTVLEDDSGIAIGEHEWHHVVVFRRDGRVGIRVDGRGTATVAYTDSMDNTQPMYLGRYETGYPWQGAIDELGLWTTGNEDIIGR
jgi:hypothetical protein